MATKNKIEKILKDFFFTDLLLDDATQQMLDLFTELEIENKKLKMIIENGLGEKDLNNDCT